MLPAIVFILTPYAKSEIIKYKEDAIIQINYNKIASKDTINSTFFTKTPMILRVGKTSAMFFPEKRMLMDSLNHFNGDAGDQMMLEVMKKGLPITSVTGWENEYLFRNIEEGKTNIYEHFATYYLGYSEPTEFPVWEISTDTKEILGFTCIRATCSYRGRQWNAWFAPEIPISEGPWKLGGLPGIVLEASDCRNHYTYKATGIRTENLPPVGIYLYYRKEPQILKDRINYLKTMYYLRLKGRFMNEISMHTKYAPSKSDKIPLYDFEETDYPHK